MLTIFMNFALTVITIITAIIIYYKWRFQYWKQRGIPSADASIPFGSLKNPLFELESFGQRFLRIYEKYKAKGCKHVGLFTFAKPVYMPIDLEIVKAVLLNDSHCFLDRGIYYNEKDDPLSAHLFSLEGAKWKKLRGKLTPAFTSGKLKSMFPLITEHVAQLKEAFNEACISKTPINAKIMMENYTADIIGSTAFGLDCNSFKNPDSEYRVRSKRFFTQTKYEAAKFMLFLNNHGLGRLLRYCMIPQEVSDFFIKTIKDTVSYRETTKFKRNDFMQLLIELKNNPDPSVSLTFNELAAQAFVFFIAATETSSSTFSFLVYELAMNQEIQEKVREEVNAIFKKYNGELTYESLFEMKYMHQVVDETLRKYPTVPVLNRICTEDYVIPGTNTTLKKGTDVIIPVLGIHQDKDYYVDPEKFDPERFQEANKAQLPSCAHLPFGEGPRICIGLRFGLMQLRVALATLLKSFKFSLEKSTPKKLKMTPYSFVTSPLDVILLNVDKINQ